MSYTSSTNPMHAVQRLNNPVLLTALAAVLMSAAAPAQSPDSFRPLVQTPSEVLDGRATLVGHYEPARMLRLAIVLTPPHMAEERQFLEDIQNKQSPLFHKYLSAEEWDARFAPSAEDEQAVVDWAKSQGLTVTRRFPDRLLVDVEAQAGTIEKAFNVTLNNYRLQSEGDDEPRIVFSSDRDPVLPSRFSEVVESVLGMNSIVVMRPHGGTGRVTPQPDYVPGPPVKDLGSLKKDASAEALRAVADEAGTPEITPPPPGYWKPTDMWSSNAYDYQALMNQGHCCNPHHSPSTHSPRESSIAIAAFGDVDFTDVNDFQSAFSYLATNVNKIAIDGGYTCNYSAGDDNCVEVTLDTEWSLAMANSEGALQDTAWVIVYEAPGCCGSDSITLFNQMATDAHARTMSTSWGFSENTSAGTIAQMKAQNNVFSKMAGEGWTLIAASGDQGATGACSDARLIISPASDPNVIAAGGTRLNEGSGPTYEVAWTGGTSPGSCSHNGGGGTGGFSVYFGAPSYQTYLGHTKRSTPDLSLDAYYGHDVYYQGNWLHLGGTSDVAPMLAGFFAQENAYLLAIGNKCGSGTAACAPIGNANYPIYREAHYKNADHSPFYDIVMGCNSNDVTAHYGLKAYCAKPGYDEATGLGSANMLQLAWAINWYTAAASGIPSVSYTGPATGKWYNHDETVSWKVVDYAGGTKGVPGTGIAGFTQGWDSIPDDPGSEPHGGSGNSFYSGPQYANDKTGCLSFDSGSCKGGVSQGCHTVHIRGWNNQGMTTGDTKYGPLCYDTRAPETTAKTSTTAGVAGVKVTLSASDPGSSVKTGSGVRATYYLLDDASCNPAHESDCNVYSNPFTVLSGGSHTVYYFSVDNAGNKEAGKSHSFTVN